MGCEICLHNCRFPYCLLDVSHKTCEYANLVIDINLEGVHLDETLLSKMSKDSYFIAIKRNTAGALGLLAAMSCLKVLTPIGQMGQIRGCQKRWPPHLLNLHIRI